MSYIKTNDLEKFSDDLLIGAAAIAEFLYGDRKATRKVYHLWKTSQAPISKLGSRLVALRSELIAYIKNWRRPKK